MQKTTKPFTIEQFYGFIRQGKLMVARCVQCGKTMLPPRPVCDQCFSNNFEWKQLTPKGKLETYTVIHVAPTQFQSLAPYAVGIVKLQEGVKLPGMIKGVAFKDLQIGMELQIEFDFNLPSEWPQWPRYYFRPV
jgi:hypothetical protein